MLSSFITSRAVPGTAPTLKATPMPPNDLLRLGIDFGTGSTRAVGQHIHGIHTRESAKIKKIQLRPDQELAIRQIMILPPEGEIIYGDHDVGKALQRDSSLKERQIRRHKLGLHPEFRGIPDVEEMWRVIFAEKDPYAIVDLLEDWFRVLFNHARAAFKRKAPSSGLSEWYWDAIPLEIHISVPAMWNHRQRATVRMAAQKAASASGSSSTKPLIALREEALCVATQFLSEDDDDENVGRSCLLVDAGDGTLDITTVKVIRARSTEAPMQLQRVGICSGSGAGSSMINAAALAWVRERYKQELDLKLGQLRITWNECSRQLWEEIDRFKPIVDQVNRKNPLSATIYSSHGRVAPGLLNEWRIDFPDEAIAQWYDTWTTAADQLLQQHLATLSTERPMTGISAILTGGGAKSQRFIERMRSRLAEHNIDCTATDDPMACAKGTLLQHYFPEDKLPDRANFYVTVHVHSDDAGEEEPEVNGYEPSGSDTDGEGKNDKSAGKFRGVTIVESSVRSGRKRRRSEDRKDTYLPDRTKIIGSYSNGEFTSMQPVPIVFHVDAEGRHLGRIHTELFMSKLRFAEHTPLKDDEGNLIPGVCTYPSMFADLDDLRAKGFEVHDSNNNRPAHFEVKAFVEMAGSSDKLLLTLHVMKPDYEFPHELDDSAPTIMEEDRLFAHTQEVWSKGCSHFTSNTTGTSLSGGDGSAETAKPARERKQRKCKKKSELSRWRAR